MSASGSLFQSLLNMLSRRISPAPPSPRPLTSPEPAPDAALTPLEPRVLLIIYNPVVDAASGRRLAETLGWNDPDQLAAGFISDVQECSAGLVRYRIVERVVADEIPVKADGFQYAVGDFVTKYRGQRGFHNPDAVDYAAIIDKFDLLTRITNNDLDEVWLFGGPYFGFYESTMVGEGAFFCNAPPIPNTDSCKRRFVIMGFSYERGVGEMLEDLGHRAESIMRQVYRNSTGDDHLFARYSKYHQVAPGQANVGLLHFAPNSIRDYDWGNPTRVPSCCDDWYRFPHLPKPPNYRIVTTRDWGNGDIRLHHQWWFKHLPRAAGDTKGIANFWWKYVIEPDTVQ